MRASLFAAALMLGVAVVTAAQGADPRAQLLPTGSLRVGLNSGNRLTRLVGRELATELARRLNAPAVFIDYPTPGAVGDAVGREWDIAFIAADPEREATMAFTPAYVELDAAYLVAANSPLRAIADIDRAGIRIATGATSAYTLVLKRDLRRAELAFMNLDEGVKAMAAGTVQAVAGLRFDLAARAASDPSLRVLPEAFARAQQAVAVPRANAAALAFVSSFVAELKRSGAIAAAVQRSGLPGATVAP